MRMFAFALRNLKEIIRDPLNLAFGLGFPVVLLSLMSIIQANIPISIFEIGNLAPGIVIFGFSFVTLFSAFLISKDRESLFLQRLYTTPLTAKDFIFGYTLPLLPLAVAQCIICYAAALLFGLEPSVNIIYAILLSIPAALFFIGLGLLFGSILSEKQVGGICGACVTTLTALLSGAWFNLEVLGEPLVSVVSALPFVHAADIGRVVLAGDFAAVCPHMVWVLGYMIIIIIAAVCLFLRQMKRQ